MAKKRKRAKAPASESEVLLKKILITQLAIAGVGQRKHRRVGRTLGGELQHAPHNAVGTRRRSGLDAVDLGFDALGRGGQIDGRNIAAHVDGVDGMPGRDNAWRRQQNRA